MRLYILPLGKCHCDKGNVLTPNSDAGKFIDIPIWSALVQANGLNILFDTGMHPVHIKNPNATFGGSPFEKLCIPVMKEEDRLENRLAEIGLKPADIHYVVNTHIHFDHAGQNYLFKDSTILVQQDHWGQAVDTLFAFQPKYWMLPELTYELMYGDYNLGPGVEITRAPGHCKGFQAPIFRLPKSGTMVMAGDLINMPENLETNNFAGMWNPIKGSSNAHRLAAIAAAEKGKILYGHDPESWSKLKLSPEYYE